MKQGRSHCKYSNDAFKTVKSVPLLSALFPTLTNSTLVKPSLLQKVALFHSNPFTYCTF